jgi:hypothetical protein
MTRLGLFAAGVLCVLCAAEVSAQVRGYAFGGEHAAGASCGERLGCAVSPIKWSPGGYANPDRSR